MKKYLIIAMLKTLRDEIENKSYIDALASVDEIFEELEKTPQKLEPLNDDEIGEILSSIDFKTMVTCDDMFYLISRAIEKAHGIE